MVDIDWEALRDAADRAGRNAYAPYSGLRVGVAGLTDTGEILVGCNVENASYGLTLCAECGLVSALAASGGGRLVAVACTAADRREVLMPCGRCRQLLHEFGGAGLLVDHPDGPLPLGELLPHAFGPDDLPEDE
jgi:cytidine deaminase